MKILVTGAAGFIGSHVARRFISLGHQVVAVDDFSNGFAENVDPRAEFIEFDLADPAVADVLPKDIEIICHLAGQASGENSFYDPIGDLDANAASTLNLIRFGIDVNARRLIFASSVSCYGDIGKETAVESMTCRPQSCYAVSKLAAEAYLKVFSDRLPFVIFRLASVYGPGQNLKNIRQGMVSIYLAQALQTGRVQVKGALDRYRDFVEVGDVAGAFAAAIDTDRADGYTMNLALGEPTTVLQILEALKTKIPEMTWFVEGSTPGDVRGMKADASRLRNILGYECTTKIEEGIGPFVDWARKQLFDAGAANS